MRLCMFLCPKTPYDLGRQFPGVREWGWMLDWLKDHRNAGLLIFASGQWRLTRAGKGVARVYS